MDDTTVKEKNRRFNFALFFTFAIIPFMFRWNIYGAIMMKSEYFVEDGGGVEYVQTESQSDSIV